MRSLLARALTREAFAPFGEVIDTDWTDRFEINAGMAERYHAIATAEATGPDARTVISIFRGKPYDVPLKLAMVERHPFGSQAFMPLGTGRFLVAVCPDTPEGPGIPQAFIASPGQGVNYRRNVWHAVLTPLETEQDFLVVDRVGAGNNLEEFFFPHTWEITLPD